MVGLAVESRPIEVAVTLPGAEAIIEGVEQELREKALTNSDSCYGYFPGLEGSQDIDNDLPACQRFAELIPYIDINGRKLSFNFLRMSLVQQHADSPFHLDSDAATALTGDTSTVRNREVWRLLVNLSTRYVRRLGYLKTDPFVLPLESQGGYINCPNGLITPDMIDKIDLVPRIRNAASGVLFCSTRVLHTGQDDQNGHFVAAFGCEK